MHIEALQSDLTCVSRRVVLEAVRSNPGSGRLDYKVSDYGVNDRALFTLSFCGLCWSLNDLEDS